MHTDVIKPKTSLTILIGILWAAHSSEPYVVPSVHPGSAAHSL